MPSASGFTSGSGTGRGSGSGSGRGAGDGNYARTSIFGAEGTGNKLVYVFDRSASTDGYQGRPLAAAKRELIASLDDLAGYPSVSNRLLQRTSHGLQSFLPAASQNAVR